MFRDVPWVWGFRTWIILVNWFGEIGMGGLCMTLGLGGGRGCMSRDRAELNLSDTTCVFSSRVLLDSDRRERNIPQSRGSSPEDRRFPQRSAVATPGRLAL